MAYRAMIFDIGGVIVPLHHERALKQMAARCGLAPAEVAARLSANDIGVRYECGQLDDASFSAELRRMLNVDLDDAQICALWCSMFDVDPLIPVPFFEELRDRYRLVLLSNTNAMHVARLRAECPAIGCFDDAAFSFVTGCMKPAPRIFQEAVRRAGCAAEECFYTDDNASFVSAARALGIDGVAFQDFFALRDAMTERGIL